MGEAKSALKALFDLAAEHKKKETSSQSTFATLRADNNEVRSVFIKDNFFDVLSYYFLRLAEETNRNAGK